VGLFRRRENVKLAVSRQFGYKTAISFSGILSEIPKKHIKTVS
jgi:hypothetical protein